MFQSFDVPLTMKLEFAISRTSAVGNLKIKEIVRVIEPWVEWLGLLYLPSILLMKSKFHFKRFVPS